MTLENERAARAPGARATAQLTRSRFAPATFEREPFETEYALRFSFTGHR
jgi:hypothetical protein